MIYFDNAATSWPKPPEVCKKILDCLNFYCANPGRSAHSMALTSENMVYSCREKISALFGLDNPENVIFTQNATHSLNIVIKGLLNKKTHAVVTAVEHNSVLRPLTATGSDYDVLTADEFGYTDISSLESCIKPNTALIICTLSSNVCGSVQPYKKIAEIAKKYKIPFLLDASQGAGSVKIDMKKDGIDFLAAPGHKGLLGPTGTGVLCINTKVEFDSIIQGGTGSLSKLITQPSILPDKFESGTLNVAGIAGLSGALDYIFENGVEKIGKMENKTVRTIAENLLTIPNVRLVGYDNSRERTAVLSFVINGIDSLIASSVLNIEHGIACRAGFHCAYTAHIALGTSATGTIRISPGVYTTSQDIDKLCYAVRKIALQSRV